MTNDRETLSNISLVVKSVALASVLGFFGYEGIKEMTNRGVGLWYGLSATQKEFEEECAVTQEVVLFTKSYPRECDSSVILRTYHDLLALSLGDVSSPFDPMTYDEFIQHANYRHFENSLLPFQEQAWLQKGDEIGKKIDPEKDFTEELCHFEYAMYVHHKDWGIAKKFSDEIVLTPTFYSAKNDVYFFERCETEYNVSGINAGALAYDLLIAAAKYCVVHDLPTMGNDFCYSTAISTLNDFVRPLAERTGYLNALDLQVNKQRLEDASRPATE